MSFDLSRDIVELIWTDAPFCALGHPFVLGSRDVQWFGAHLAGQILNHATRPPKPHCSRKGTLYAVELLPLHPSTSWRQCSAPRRIRSCVHPGRRQEKETA